MTFAARELCTIRDQNPALLLIPNTRVLVRQEQPHPGANYNLFDPNGLRHQALITNSQDPDVAYLEARHRVQANQVWLFLVQLAQNLLCWAKRSCLGPDFLLARPKRLRYQLLQVAGRLVHTGRRSILKLDARWPWAKELELAFTRLRSLPLSP